MADFQHYATFAEAIEILRDVMETYSLRAIANPPILESPHATTYDALTPEAEGAIRAAGRVLLEGHYTIAPLRFLEREDAERTYYIDTMSGPRLNWVIPRKNAPDTTLAPGSVILLNSYLDPDSGDWLKPSEELKASYKQVVAAIKKHMVRVPIRKGDRIWVGKQTKLLLDKGTVRIDR